LYAVGGSDEYGNPLSSVERYDEAKEQWEVIASMGSARYGVGVCVLGSRLYAVGGEEEDDNSLSSVERYDEAKDQWEEVASMSTARFLPGVCVTPPTWVPTDPSSVPSEVLSLDDDDY
jgi:hypothetical protein